ncbi:3-deoxy-D-manno-octulosonate 8-phosphate phosphatase [Lunatimonas lonarensis]|uniref:3-deoxy-D-manno-octulosonate 8-phosphate phosphatase n=1 Tax=Lunatimonas lonarensis TaxID=1232681 RepID=R7ZLR7_9BACT|nr:3-deoxy-D-manno-octulosonate 8-phosphate phosphatase [Lunatimonas lonarensis]EON75017.1 3-deoxy-D-manno-octulosonate 8-phosphate phosphatase [Lunatimonas lonarensis]
MYRLQEIPPRLREKMKEIKVLITDVDGVLTDGGIILDDSGVEYKRFQVKDGQIIPFLKKFGLLVGAVSGRDVDVVKRRCEQMRLDFHFHGVKNKLGLIADLLEERGLTLAECAYIGDDIIDLDVLLNVGVSAAPRDALPYVCDKVDFVCSLPGGAGAFRELADTLLHVRGNLDEALRSLDIA